MKFRVGSSLLLSSIFHFISGVDTSQHDKDDQESTEDEQG